MTGAARLADCPAAADEPTPLKAATAAAEALATASAVWPPVLADIWFNMASFRSLPGIALGDVQGQGRRRQPISRPVPPSRCAHGRHTGPLPDTQQRSIERAVCL